MIISVGGASVRVHAESPAGAINGSNTVFTTSSNFELGTESLYFNGVLQEEGALNDYVASESGGLGTGYDTITLNIAPRSRTLPRVGDKITIDYDLA